MFITIIFIADNAHTDTTYIIQKGDNPSTIAKKFNAKIENIISTNNLNPTKLRPGTKIIIPSIEKKPLCRDNLRQTSRTTLDNDNRGEDLSEDNIIHTVKRGETLSSLSRKYAIPMHELQEINNLKSTKIIVGQKLLVKQTKIRTYTVKKGDSLWKIARRFHLDVKVLREINELNIDVLKPGQKILLQHQGDPEHFNNPEANHSMKHIEDGIDKVSESDEYTLKEKLILLAKKFLDIPYRFGGKTFFGIDCSAFVQKVFSLIGIDLPRSAREQFFLGDPVDREDLSIGDLVFFRTYASFPSHVGIYLGNNEFIHASSKLKKVTIDSLETQYYLKRYIGAKRLIEEEVEKKGELQGES